MDKDDRLDQEIMCELNAGARLEELIQKRRARPFERETTKRAIHGLVAQEHEMGFDEVCKEIAQATVSFNKWQYSHKYVRFSPFRDHQNISRSAQWRDTLNKFRDLRDKELLDQVAINIQVAANIENGIREMRLRKNGPTPPEWVSHPFSTVIPCPHPCNKTPAQLIESPSSGGRH